MSMTQGNLSFLSLNLSWVKYDQRSVELSLYFDYSQVLEIIGNVFELA